MAPSALRIILHLFNRSALDSSQFESPWSVDVDAYTNYQNAYAVLSRDYRGIFLQVSTAVWKVGRPECCGTKEVYGRRCWRAPFRIRLSCVCPLTAGNRI